MRLKDFVKNRLLKQKTEIEQKLDLRKFLVPNKTGNLFDCETSYLTPNPNQFGVEVSDFLVDSTHPNTVKISLDLAAIVKAQKIAPNFAKIEPYYYPDEDESLPADLHTLQLGYYPLERSFTAIDKLNAKPTQKNYAGYAELETENGSRYAVDELDGKGNRFIVQPLKWTILNYRDLTKELNPQGTGSAKTIELASGNVIPLYYSSHDKKSFLEESLVVSSKFMKFQGIKNVNALTKYINKIDQHDIQVQNNSEMSR